MKSGLNANARVYVTSMGRSGIHPTRVDTVDADEEEELEPAPEEITEEPSTFNLQTQSLHLSSFSYWGH